MIVIFEWKDVQLQLSSLLSAWESSQGAHDRCPRALVRILDQGYALSAIGYDRKIYKKVQ